jgi:hypothetical protein
LKHFQEYSALKQHGSKRLLLVDGHGSHHTFQFIQYCEQHNIFPFGMPPNLTHLLQPVDVAVFQPLKHHQAKALDIIVRDGCTKITKLEFLSYIQEIRIQAMKESTVKSAFRKTGIWPFSPQVVLQQIASRIPEHTPSPPPFLNPQAPFFRPLLRCGTHIRFLIQLKIIWPSIWI